MTIPDDNDLELHKKERMTMILIPDLWLLVNILESSPSESQEKKHQDM